MPNWVKHSMEIRGNAEIVKRCIDVIGRDVPRALRTSVDGESICRRKGVGEFTVGWYNEISGKLVERKGGLVTIQKSGDLPDEWEREYKEAHRVWIDFERIVPPPDYLFKGGLGQKDEEANPGRNWLHWNRRCWGTKWGASSTEKDDEGRIIFETAWSVPVPVLVELSFLFPELTFHVQAIDEGWCFAGVWIFQNGEHTESDIICDGDDLKFRDLYKKLYGEHPPKDED